MDCKHQIYVDEQVAWNTIRLLARFAVKVAPEPRRCEACGYYEIEPKKVRNHD